MQLVCCFTILHSLYTHILLRVERFTQHSGVAFMLMIGIAYLAMNMENNESRLLSVPKHEFTRVLADIMNGTSTPINDYKNNRKGVTKNSEGIYPGNLDRRVNREIVTPRSAAIQKAIHNEEMKSKKYYATVKHDSFYFLQKSLMKRNGKEANVYSDAMYGTDDEDMDTPRSNGHTPRSHISKMF